MVVSLVSWRAGGDEDLVDVNDIKVAIGRKESSEFHVMGFLTFFSLLYLRALCKA